MRRVVTAVSVRMAFVARTGRERPLRRVRQAALFIAQLKGK